MYTNTMAFIWGCMSIFVALISLVKIYSWEKKQRISETYPRRREYKAIKVQLQDALDLLDSKNDELATKEVALTKWTEAASKLQNRINELEAGAMAVAGELDHYRHIDPYSIISYTQPPAGKKRRKKK